MSVPHPTRIVRFHLLAVLLGVSIPFAIEDVVHDPSKPVVLATIAFLFTSLNFFHGKVVTLEDDDYNNALTDRVDLALIDYLLNVAVILCFVFMAFFLGKPGRLVITNLILRALDTVLVLNVRRALPRDAIRKAQNTWLAINLAAVICFLGFSWLYWPVSAHPQAVSVIFLVIIIADIVIDYRLNRKLYFDVADSWDEMAGFWDAIQGERGDIYRQTVIVPAILETIELGSMRILDAGCGNGCISRALSQAGATVFGVDSSPNHLDIARSYPSEGVSYHLANLNESEGCIEGNPFDMAVLCFTLQDCDTLEAPLSRITQNLRPLGRVLVILENDRSFGDIQAHSTTRRWLSPRRFSGSGRRQLIVWKPHIIRSLRVGNSDPDLDKIEREWPHGFKTITHHWSISSYVDAARKSGLRKLSIEKELPIRKTLQAGQREPSCLARYRNRPRFDMLVFEKMPVDAGLSTNG